MLQKRISRRTAIGTNNAKSTANTTITSSSPTTYELVAANKRYFMRHKSKALYFIAAKNMPSPYSSSGLIFQFNTTHKT